MFLVATAAALAGVGAWILAAGSYPVVGAIDIAVAVFCLGLAVLTR